MQDDGPFIYKAYSVCPLVHPKKCVPYGNVAVSDEKQPGKNFFPKTLVGRKNKLPIPTNPREYVPLEEFLREYVIPPEYYDHHLLDSYMERGHALDRINPAKMLAKTFNSKYNVFHPSNGRSAIKMKRFKEANKKKPTTRTLAYHAFPYPKHSLHRMNAPPAESKYRKSRVYWNDWKPSDADGDFRPVVYPRSQDDENDEIRRVNARIKIRDWIFKRRPPQPRTVVDIRARYRRRFRNPNNNMENGGATGAGYGLAGPPPEEMPPSQQEEEEVRPPPPRSRFNRNRNRTPTPPSQPDPGLFQDLPPYQPGLAPIQIQAPQQPFVFDQPPAFDYAPPVQPVQPNEENILEEQIIPREQNIPRRPRTRQYLVQYDKSERMNTRLTTRRMDQLKKAILRRDENSAAAQRQYKRMGGKIFYN